MDAEGAVLASHEGARTVPGFDATGKDVKSYVDLKKKIDDGKADRATQVEFFVAACRLKTMKLADAEAKSKELKDLAAPEQKKVKSALVNLEIAELTDTVSRDNQAEVAQKCYDLRKAGKVATSPDGLVWEFWYYVLMHCETAKDAPTYEQGLAVLKPRFKDQQDYKQPLQQMEKTLKLLKSGK